MLWKQEGYFGNCFFVGYVNVWCNISSMFCAILMNKKCSNASLCCWELCRNRLKKNLYATKNTYPSNLWPYQQYFRVDWKPSQHKSYRIIFVLFEYIKAIKGKCPINPLLLLKTNSYTQYYPSSILPFNPIILSPSNQYHHYNVTGLSITKSVTAQFAFRNHSNANHLAKLVNKWRCHNRRSHNSE